MFRWIAVIAIAFFGGNYVQRLLGNHGVDVWVARGSAIAIVALIALVGYFLFLRPVPEK